MSFLISQWGRYKSSTETIFEIASILNIDNGQKPRNQKHYRHTRTNMSGVCYVPSRISRLVCEQRPLKVEHDAYWTWPHWFFSQYHTYHRIRMFVKTIPVHYEVYYNSSHRHTIIQYFFECFQVGLWPLGGFFYHSGFSKVLDKSYRLRV